MIPREPQPPASSPMQLFNRVTGAWLQYFVDIVRYLTRLLQVGVLRGTRAAQPPADTVLPGTLYFVTDEGITEQSDGVAWFPYSPTITGGDVVGPASAADDGLVLFDGVTGKQIKQASGTGLVTVIGGVYQPPVPGVPILQRVTVLTDAAIKALPTTPVVLVAGVANARIKPLAVQVLLDNAAGGYTNIDPAYAALQFRATSLWLAQALIDDAAVPITQFTDMVGVAGRWLYDAAPPYVELADLASTWIVGNGGQPVAALDGEAFILDIDNNGAGDLTGGDAANTLTVTVYYRIEPTV